MRTLHITAIIACLILISACGSRNEVVQKYEGLLPAADCPGIRYTLTVRHQEHSGDGTFSLDMTYLEAEDGKDATFTYTGRRYTQRGIPGDDNATVWQLVTDDGEDTFNFLVEDSLTITLLNRDFQKSDTGLNYSLTLTE